VSDVLIRQQGGGREINHAKIMFNMQAQTFAAKERAHKAALMHQMLKRIRTAGENKFNAKRAHKSNDCNMGQNRGEASYGVSAAGRKLNTVPLLKLHPAFQSSSLVCSQQTGPSTSSLNVNNSQPYFLSEAPNSCLRDAGQIVTHTASPEPIVFNPSRVDVSDEIMDEDKCHGDEELGRRFYTRGIISGEKLKPRLQLLSGSESDKQGNRAPSHHNRGNLLTAAKTIFPASKVMMGNDGKRGLISKQKSAGPICGVVTDPAHARQCFAGGDSREDIIILSDSESEPGHRHGDMLNDSDGEFAGLLEKQLMDTVERLSDDEAQEAAAEPVLLAGRSSDKSNRVTQMIYGAAKKSRMDQKEHQGSLKTFSKVVLPQCKRNDRRGKDFIYPPALISKGKGVHGFEGEREGWQPSRFENHRKLRTRSRCEGDRCDAQHLEFMLQHDSLDKGHMWFERQADNRGMYHHKKQRDICGTQTTCRVVEDMIHEPVLEKRLHSTTGPSQKEILIPTTCTAFR